MPKYQVVVNRRASHEARVTVDAKNKAEATRVAEVLVSSQGSDAWEMMEVAFDYETFLAPSHPGDDE